MICMCYKKSCKMMTSAVCMNRISDGSIMVSLPYQIRTTLSCLQAFCSRYDSQNPPVAYFHFYSKTALEGGMSPDNFYTFLNVYLSSLGTVYRYSGLTLAKSIVVVMTGIITGLCAIIIMEGSSTLLRWRNDQVQLMLNQHEISQSFMFLVLYGSALVIFGGCMVSYILGVASENKYARMLEWLILCCQKTINFFGVTKPLHRPNSIHS